MTVFNGSKLNKARHMRRLTIEELAFISEIKQSTLIEYEKGFKKITEQDSIILSGFLGCNPDWLRG
jgi:transcriptional regulator with XRE-family HTH domain